MGKGLLAPACNDTHNSLLVEHSDLALCLGSTLTNTKLNPKWDRVQKIICYKLVCEGAKAGFRNTEYEVIHGVERCLHAASYLVSLSRSHAVP